MMLRPFLLVAGLLGAGLASAAVDRPHTDAERGFQAKTMRIIQGLLSDERYALRARPLEAMAGPAFDAYVDSLDPERRYLTAEDLSALQKARAALPHAIQGKDLEPAYRIFDAYAARVAERVAFARAQLAAPADYASPGIWVPDRSAMPRPADQAELDDLWRRLVRNDRLELHLAGLSEDAIRALLEERYVRWGGRVDAFGSRDVFEAFASAVAASVDADANFRLPGKPPVVSGVEMDRDGIGMVVKREGAFFTVQQVVPGGPAARAGVRAGERLLAVAEDETPWSPLPGRELDEVVEALRGVTGSRLRLRLGSASGESRELALHRAAVDPTRDEARQTVLTLGERRIGVVTLPVFYADFEARRRGDPNARSSASDVAAMLRELKQQDVDGVLLDLRGNGGGALLEGVEVAGLFLGREPVVQVRETGGRVSVQAGSTAALWKGPVAVLVDSRSAAASEVVVAALQDHGRALVIGERSFGRDSIQAMLDLGRGSSGAGGYLTLTVGELFRVDGRSIGPGGVEPWLALPDAAAAGLREPAAGPARRIAAATGFKAPAPPAPAPALTGGTFDDPAFRAWQARWLRARALREANAVSLEADARRAAIDRAQSDDEVAGQDDVALAVAAAAFSASLGGAPAPAR